MNDISKNDITDNINILEDINKKFKLPIYYLDKYILNKNPNTFKLHMALK